MNEETSKRVEEIRKFNLIKPQSSAEAFESNNTNFLLSVIDSVKFSADYRKSSMNGKNGEIVDLERKVDNLEAKLKLAEEGLAGCLSSLSSAIDIGGLDPKKALDGFEEVLKQIRNEDGTKQN